LVFDLGSGSALLRDYLRLDKETHIFLSHYHLDHTVGLSFLLGTFRSGKKLKIWGQKGVEKVVRDLMSPPYFPVPIEKWPFAVEFGEIGAEQQVADCRVLSLPLEHSNPCIGFRVENGGKTLVYATDTHKCANAVKLAKNADLLIHDATYHSGNLVGKSHSTAKEAAEVAKEAGAEKLALFQIDAECDDTCTGLLLKEAKDVFKNSFIPKEGSSLIL
jgi:ribonuclease BN (tRNA processing enzyme)